MSGITTDVFTLEPPEWTVGAICASTDPELFFPEKGGSTREAKKVCAGCPVRVECAEYALDLDDRFGVWGGLSERERRRLLSNGWQPGDETARGHPADVRDERARILPGLRTVLRPHRRTHQAPPRLPARRRMTAPTAALSCRCGHAPTDHLAPQCSHRGCTCLHYRPAPASTPTSTGATVTAMPQPIAQPSMPRPTEPSIAARGERGPSLEQILAAGKRSEHPRTVKLTEKIALLVHDLRSRLADEREAAETKRQIDEQKAAARAEVERLERELAAAKARLTGRTPPSRNKPSGDTHRCDDCGHNVNSAHGLKIHRARLHKAG